MLAFEVINKYDGFVKIFIVTRKSPFRKLESLFKIRMSQDYILSYLNQHCRFVLKSGKEVFGVVWQISQNGREQYYFSSVSDHLAFSNSRDLAQAPNSLPLNLEEIIHVEKIVA